MNPKPFPRPEHARKQAPARTADFLTIISWGIAGIAVVLTAALAIWRPEAIFSDAPQESSLPASALAGSVVTAQLPPFSPEPILSALVRQPDLHTTVPEEEHFDIDSYTIAEGDALFNIAKDYDLKPDSILWANYSTLNDNPDMITPGMVLKIPPTDGVLYEWKDGDTPDAIAARFNADVIDLLAYPGNDLDMTNPDIKPGTLVMVPGGKREYRSWVIPVIPRGRAGVNRTIIGPGACETGDGGYMGGGYFVWPTPNTHTISGNDFWDGHLGLDIAAGMGTPILAADSGVVVYSGAISGGYGNMVMIDHGNGYQTLYAHLSKMAVRCGASVGQGGVIGWAGSTGNSTGPHLHFEVRYFGAFINPWTVLN